MKLIDKRKEKHIIRKNKMTNMIELKKEIKKLTKELIGVPITLNTSRFNYINKEELTKIRDWFLSKKGVKK